MQYNTIQCTFYKHRENPRELDKITWVRLQCLQRE